MWHQELNLGWVHNLHKPELLSYPPAWHHFSFLCIWRCKWMFKMSKITFMNVESIKQHNQRAWGWALWDGISPCLWFSKTLQLLGRDPPVPRVGWQVSQRPSFAFPRPFCLCGNCSNQPLIPTATLGSSKMMMTFRIHLIFHMPSIKSIYDISLPNHILL